MSNKAKLVAVMALFSASAMAADPPPSGLGKTVTNTSSGDKSANSSKSQKQVRPEVVMPKPQDVVEDTIQLMEGVTPTPDQFDRLKRLYIRKEQQQAMPYTSPAKPVTRSLLYSLEAGVTPPVVRLAQGQLTSLVFSDLQGNPWIIEKVSLDRDRFDDGGAAGETNILTLWPTSAAGYSNAAIRLKGLPVPVIVQLASNQKEVDMRLDIQVPGRNPDAIGEQDETQTIPVIDHALTLFLDGVPPKDAKRLKATGLPGTEAWMFRGNMYVRTAATAQYPAYMASARSAANVRVYRYSQRLNQVVLLMNSQATTVFLEE
jgi:intracellular multiplication protein IcmK